MSNGAGTSTIRGYGGQKNNPSLFSSSRIYINIFASLDVCVCVFFLKNKTTKMELVNSFKSELELICSRCIHPDSRSGSKNEWIYGFMTFGWLLSFIVAFVPFFSKYLLCRFQKFCYVLFRKEKYNLILNCFHAR